MDKLNAYINEVMNFAELKKSEELTNLMKKYVDMLFSWHETHNIISTRDPIYFIKRDMCDCLNICKYLPDGKLLDVGTGGGIPGILIAMIKKESQIILLDKKEKPIRFLDQVKLKLRIENITPVKETFENYKVKSDLSAIVLKNFSTKALTKMDYYQKVLSITKTARKNLGTNLPVYFLTGSNALSLRKHIEEKSKNEKNRLSLTQIDSPFFQNSRYLVQSWT